MMVYFMDIRYILRPFGILYEHLVYFAVIWYIFPRFGMLHREKSGNPGVKAASGGSATRRSHSKTEKEFRSLENQKKETKRTFLCRVLKAWEE
jgi:hypothetical protein